MKTTLLLLPLLLGPMAAAAPPPAPPAQLLDAAFLESIRLEVRTNHPSVAAAQARLEAAHEGIQAVRLWDDPMAGFGVMAADEEMRRDEGDLMFSIEQALPRRKLYEARKTQATAERAMFEAEMRSTILELEARTAQTGINLALLDEILALETSQLAWLEAMAANARELLKDPMATAAEALRIESELAMERQRIESARRNRVLLVRQINLLLGRDPESAWPTLRLPAPGSSDEGADHDLSHLIEVNPMLRALLETAEATRAEVEVMRRESRPMFAVGVESSIYSGGDFRQVTFGAKMTLPWLNRRLYRAGTARAQQQMRAAEQDFAALARQLRSEALASRTEAENAAREGETIARQVIPRAESALTSVESAWLSSKAGLLEVFEARRALLQAHMEERRAAAMQQSALEMLRTIVPPSASTPPPQP